MGKKSQRNEWIPIQIDGSACSNLEGLIGIEECKDYDLGSVLKSSYRKKTQEKKKETTKKRKKQKIDESDKDDEIEESKQAKPAKKRKKQKIDVSEVVESIPESKQTVSKLSKTSKKHKKQKIEENTDITPSKSGKTQSKSSKKVSKSPKKTQTDKIEPKKQVTIDLNTVKAWTTVPLREPLLKALALQNFTEPTEIQSLTLPPAILGRRDILGAAETGSGKTLAFGLPILNGILHLKEKMLENDDKDDNQVDEDDILGDEDDLPDDEDENLSDEDKNLSDEDENGVISDDNDEIVNDDDVISDEDDIGSNEDLTSDEDGILSDEDEQFDDDDEENDESASVDEDEHLEESDFEENEEMVDDLNEDGMGCVRSVNNIAPTVKPNKPLYALILTPTRELAIQIKNHLVAAAKFTDIRIAVVVGGMSIEKQERVLSKGPEIVIATPGRLWNLIEEGNNHLLGIDNIKYLAIDETDRMIERGHFQELHHILEKINIDRRKREQRQNFVFSATLTLIHELPKYLLVKKKMNRQRSKIGDLTPVQKLERIVGILGITNPKVVDITKGKGTSNTLTESRITCDIDEKDFYVYYFLKRHVGRTLIFCNSIGCVRRLVSLLSLLDCKPLPLHASMQQRQRLKNLDRFKADENSLLIATDVAARGLDIPSIQHVIHYQTPRTSESYVHRSGRTARATKEGLTVLLVEPGELKNYFKLCRTLGKTEDIPLFPVQETILNSVKQRVNLARELDKLELRVRKANSESGWMQKAAEEMDMIFDEDACKYDSIEAKKLKKVADFKRRELASLLTVPLFPKDFSLRYPTSKGQLDLTVASGGIQTSETAIDVMKNSMGDGKKTKKERRAKHLFTSRITTGNSDGNIKLTVGNGKQKQGRNGKWNNGRANKKFKRSRN